MAQVVNRIIDIDHGWKAIRRNLSAAGNLAVKVGFLEGEPRVNKDGSPALTLAQVAAWNEFGNARVPERPFFRSALDDGDAEIKKAQEALLNQVISLKMGVERALGLLGAKVASMVQKKIRSNIPPPNAPSTIARKGSTKTLVDTGQMIQGVRWVVVNPEEARL